MNWKIGQKLVCIMSSEYEWIHPDGTLCKFQPKNNFVYTFDGIEYENSNYIYLKECLIIDKEENKRLAFKEKHFKPFISQQEEMNKAKEEILNKEIVFN